MHVQNYFCTKVKNGKLFLKDMIKNGCCKGIWRNEMSFKWDIFSNEIHFFIYAT